MASSLALARLALRSLPRARTLPALISSRISTSTPDAAQPEHLNVLAHSKNLVRLLRPLLLDH